MRCRAVLLAAVLVGAGGSPASAQVDILAGWAAGPTDVWAVTSGRTSNVVRFDGRSWQQTALPAGSGRAFAVWASGPRDVFLAGIGGLFLRWDGSVWQQIESGTEGTLVAVRGRSATDVFVVAQSDDEGEAPVLMRWDGTRFSSYPLPIALQVSGLAVTPTEVLVTGVVTVDPRPDIRRTFGVIARWRAGAWSLDGYDGRRVTDSLVAGVGYQRVCATATAAVAAGYTDAWSQRAVVRRAGRWTPLEPPALPDDPPADNGWMVFTQDCTPIYINSPHVARYQAGRWQVVSSPAVGGGVGWGLGARDLWVGTPEGRILRVSGDSVHTSFDAACLEARFANTARCAGSSTAPAAGTRSTLPQPIRPPSKQRRP